MSARGFGGTRRPEPTNVQVQRRRFAQSFPQGSDHPGCARQRRPGDAASTQGACCADAQPRANEALLVIDVQRDFIPGRALAVPDGDAVIGSINRLLAHFPHAIPTQDWYPPGHASFAKTHAGMRPFETATLSYGEQTLWPDHCIIGSEGAEFGPALDLRRVELVLRKGFRPGIDGYSGLRENDRTTVTGLHGYLTERGLRRLFLAGLARDYCVHHTAVDALAFGYEVIVIEDACRAIDFTAVSTSSQSTTVNVLLA